MSLSKVFVFEKINGGLVQTNFFQPLDGIPSDGYGISVSIDNNFT